jgi:hypothetical protein
MAERCDEDFENLQLNKSDFNPGTMEDELRVDGLCKDLLLRFYEETCAQGISATEATALASSADYFLRDFVVSIKQQNVFDERTGIVRQFAGNWYIVNTLEPSAAEVGRHLQGIRAFYRFLHGHGLISLNYLQAIEKECDDSDFYAARIDSFWDIQGDGYGEWERLCSLKDQ